jgi:hypothetical protein
MAYPKWVILPKTGRRRHPGEIYKNERFPEAFPAGLGRSFGQAGSLPQEKTSFTYKTRYLDRTARNIPGIGTASAKVSPTARKRMLREKGLFRIFAGPGPAFETGPDQANLRYLFNQWS